jgi:ubiquitin-protein ligase
MRNLIKFIQTALARPDPEYPADEQAAYMYKFNRKEYLKKAKEFSRSDAGQQD